MTDSVRDEAPRRGASRLGRAAMGERLGGYIYGTIVVLSVVVVGARAYPHESAHIAGLVAATTFAFWLAHVYAHALAHSVARDQHLSVAELLYIARREASIMEAAVPPVAALLLGELGVISDQVAVWTAFVLGLVVLAAQGVTVARVERLGRLGTLAVVAGNVSLGVLLVGLKLLVSH
ncbi:MAG TPA: hypothetical protein VF063_04080 [Gaiellaceae bacterium]